MLDEVKIGRKGGSVMEEIKNLRKAAILWLSLERREAELMLEGLTEQQQRELAEAVVELGEAKGVGGNRCLRGTVWRGVGLVVAKRIEFGKKREAAGVFAGSG